MLGDSIYKIDIVEYSFDNSRQHDGHATLFWTKYLSDSWKCNIVLVVNFLSCVWNDR